MDYRFNESFYVQTAHGFQFNKRWQRGEGHMCDRSAEVCTVNAGLLPVDPIVEAFLRDSEVSFTIAPDVQENFQNQLLTDLKKPAVGRSRNLVFHESNDSFTALGLGITLTEAVLQMSQFPINLLVASLHSKNADTVFPCRDHGTVTMEFRDNDNSLTISDNDSVSLQFSNCFDYAINDRADGSMVLHLGSFVNEPNKIYIAGVLDYSDGIQISDHEDDTVVQVSGSHSIQYSLEGFSEASAGVTGTAEKLSAQAIDSQYFSVASGGFREVLSEFSLSKYAGPGKIFSEVNFSVHINSELLGGSFSCGSDQFQQSQGQNNYVVCYGLNQSAIRIEDRLRRISRDANGDGFFQDTNFMIIPFHEFTEGFLDRRSSNNLVKHGGILVVEKLLITANDIIQDADGSGVFISVAKGINANTLLRYDLESDAAEEVLRFEGEPNRLALSNDGSRLYVSFADSNRVRAFSSLDYRELYSVTVPAGKVVLDIDTSPVRADEIAVVASQVPCVSTSSHTLAVWDNIDFRVKHTGPMLCQNQYREINLTPRSYQSRRLKNVPAAVSAPRTSYGSSRKSLPASAVSWVLCFGGKKSITANCLPGGGSLRNTA